MTTKRTDCHRPGAIIPAHYTLVLSYATGSAGAPGIGINCVYDLAHRNENGAIIKYGEHAPGGMCCVVALNTISKVPFAPQGGLNKCSICSTNYRYGDVWRHDPTGEHIHVGHNCAEKYEMLADRSAFELARDRMKAAEARQLQVVINQEKRAKFLAQHPGLEDALKVDHRIVAEIGVRFQTYCTLSDKQVALVMKLAAEVKAPKAEEVKVEAPTGKQTFRGTVVSVKQQDGNWGTQLKCVVKVQAEGGVWLAWGTLPAGISQDNMGHVGNVRGCEVEITATLKPGREKGFAIMGRPAGRVLKQSCSAEAGCHNCQVEAAVPVIVAFLTGR